ncbi:ribonuclease H-like protein [Lentinus tigrinus ALCF2SS1-7]|uniref:ribonuclease H-like protein n=1 Tax=Lentinus tigrinus ALCF2SS1-7 TaxID=1328758 RepID=UPI001166143B|nr:ribonuclease H-like protein [Lentinus tigrinus ALCF2SS1-7]
MGFENQSSKPASANWLALQKKISLKRPGTVSAFAARKRRKLDGTPEPRASTQPEVPETQSFPRGTSAGANVAVYDGPEIKNGESLTQLRRMVLEEVEHTASHKQPGKYLALDCEMVGVGIEGSESALARVSLVNFHGHTVLDVIVRPKERVVDYRTEFSGIRPSDMVHARPFEEVQKEVSELLKDRILVGHAVHNDLKALLLSHPRPQTRDTQILAYKHKVSRGRRPALRHLVKQELGLTIQGGEHSSVTDARATMALFRLHRRTWEKNVRPLSSASIPKKRPRSASVDEAPSGDEGEDEDEEVGADALHPSATSPHHTKKKGKTKAKESFPGGGRRGVSSGLSTIVKRVGVSGKSSREQAKVKTKAKTKDKWWKELGGGGSKGSVRLQVD